MKTNCSSKNPLQRDGTSQQQRTLKTLLPGYIPVDERDMDDLREFAAQYAEEIHYYDLENQKDGNWSDFLDKNTDNTEYNAPHYTLFITFLKLFKYARDEMNKITKKHLDFYYRDVLHLKENAAVPDQVFLVFELAKHVKTKKHLLTKGTKLKAGKDSEGNNLTYKLASNMTLNVASVSEMKAVFSNVNDSHKRLQNYPANDHRIYASPKANSLDGKGAKLSKDDKSWRTFGTVKFPNIKESGDNQFKADRKQAEIGFAFASPNLFLAEGERIITINLNFSSDSALLDEITNPHLYNAFRVMFSGEKKWIGPIWETTRSSSEGEIDPIILDRIFDFLNAATEPADIAGIEPQEGPIYDDPTKGYGDQIKDYDIGLSVAEEILRVRDDDFDGQFEKIEDIRSVSYVGEDKINDLAYTFSNPVHSTTVDRANNRIIIKRTITKAQEAIVAYDKEKLLDPFDTKWPVAKILLNKKYKHNPYIYKLLKDFTLESVDLKVEVREVRDVIVQNDQSVLDPGKPFEPFTNRPQIGANFYIGSWETFQKNISSLNIDIKWHGLPTDAKGFEDYYENYYPADTRNNTTFKADIGILEKKAWISLNPESNQLFNNEDDEKLEFKNTFNITNDVTDPTSTIGGVERDIRLSTLKKYDQNTQKGFVRLSLKGEDFGHKDYHISYTRAVVHNIGVDLVPPIVDYSGKLPNEPYTPSLEEIWLDYVASEHIVMHKVSSEDYKDRVEQYFHIHPFGVGEVDTQQDLNYLIPQYLEEGALYVGVKDINPPENLSLLIQILEGSSDPDLLPPDVTWSYLSKNEWKKFPDANILSDSTKGLITTGVVLFDMPSEATKDNSILTNGIYWLRATVDSNARAIPHLIDIKAQAVAAVFEDDDNVADHLSAPLKQKTISKLVKADSSVKSIDQPYTSFGGKVKEESSAFYTRVSERLRHKKRAITIWDYERLVLQRFPSVYKVKCLNHTRFEGTLKNISEAAPGHVSLIVISNVRNKNAVDPLKPRTSLSTISEIEEFIQSVQPSCVKLHVKNPIFEEIKVEFNVKFHQGFDKGLYETILINAIKQYLSPWAFESGSDLVFGGKIHKSMILHFVEQQVYVDYVTCFQMFHVVPDDPENNSTRDVDEAVASTSASVLGSASSHDITPLKKEDECRCDDNVVVTAELVSVDECLCD